MAHTNDLLPLPAQGLGADNAPGHKDMPNPLDAPVAGDSGALPNVGITEINNKSANKSGECHVTAMSLVFFLSPALIFCIIATGALNTEGTDGTTRVGAGAPVSAVAATRYALDVRH